MPDAPFHFDLTRPRRHRLGAHAEEGGTSFALFSDHAERVELVLYDAPGGREIFRGDLPHEEGGIFEGFLAGAGPGTLYGYRVHGPWAPEEGHRFNPAKLLLDPYALGIKGDLIWDDALFGHRMEGEDEVRDERDSAPFMPLAEVVEESFDWEDDAPPRHPWSKTVIYETHLRGATMRHPNIPEDKRGSFAAIASEPMLAHYRALGVTTIELLPIHSFVTDKFLIDKGLSNYWGYNTLSFFAPHRPYLASGAADEVKTAIKTLHRAGIEVVLDVVYNHTAEGSELGPTLSFRGIDNASYYMLAEDRRHTFDTTGTGNALNLGHPMVLRMVLDSLRYWVREMHVDGFRFDLASTLGRGPEGFDQRSAFFAAIAQDPVLSGVKLIAEPWDIGEGGYQLGGFPWPFREWNDKFRDDLRRFWKGDAVLPRLSQRLLGSPVQFDHSRRPATSSVNFVTAHDGFTLMDLVSYDAPQNEANGEGGADGHDTNHSDNFGQNGPSDDVRITAARLRRMRAMLATVLLSQGVPMLQGGDEFGRSQQGNNNAYCQDNEISWTDWAGNLDLTGFLRRLIDLRGALNLAADAFTGRSGGPSVEWLHPAGKAMVEEDWQDEGLRIFGLKLDRDATEVLLVLNAGPPGHFALPEGGWQQRFSSAEEDGGPEAAEVAGTAEIPEQALLVFARAK